MSLGIKENKDIILTIPNRVSIERGKEFVKQKINWIKKQQKLCDEFNNKKESTDFENGDILYFLGNQFILKVIPSDKNSIYLNGKYIELNIKKNYIDNKKYIENAYNKLLKEAGARVFNNIVIKYQEKMAKYKIKVPDIEIRKMKTRWGICYSNRNKIVLNLSLIKTPVFCIEYVVVHELSHFRYQNHSKYFYNFVSLFIPDWNKRRKILNKEYGFVI